MRVKRYVSPSIHEAMERIRVDLGKDAVILNTKRIRTGGFLGLFKKEEFEVIAAIDEVKSKDLPSTRDQVEQSREAVLDEIKKTVSKETRDVIEPVENYSRKNTTHEQNEMLREVKEMREMMTQLMKKNEQSQLYPPVFQSVVDRLRDQEVEEQVISYIVDEVRKSYNISTLTEQEALHLVRNQITTLLKSRFTAPIHPTTRLFHVVGPTGVGKTTTIAKLAANLMLKQNKKIGLITTDTYRIAAIDQLRTYANILNAPLEVVYKAEELHGAIANLAENDVIIMDTAGRNYRNKQYVEDVAEFLDSTLPSETFLVLSLTSKYKDNLSIIRQFSELKIDKVMYTKLDETETYGTILNIAYHYPLQLSFISNGQTVPDDLFVANPEKVTEILLGGVHVDV